MNTYCHSDANSCFGYRMPKKILAKQGKKMRGKARKAGKAELLANFSNPVLGLFRILMMAAVSEQARDFEEGTREFFSSSRCPAKICALILDGYPSLSMDEAYEMIQSYGLSFSQQQLLDQLVFNKSGSYYRRAYAFPITGTFFTFTICEHCFARRCDEVYMDDDMENARYCDVPMSGCSDCFDGQETARFPCA
jgi:hypothetical protein